MTGFDKVGIEEKGLKSVWEWAFFLYGHSPSLCGKNWHGYINDAIFCDQCEKARPEATERKKRLIKSLLGMAQWYKRSMALHDGTPI